MKDEYIIINKTAIQKRIEELEKQYGLLSNKSDRLLSDIEEEREIVGEQRGLSQILSQSTPLIPELEKAFDEGFHKGYGVGQGDARNHPLALTLANHIHEERQDYISNLKLDI